MSNKEPISFSEIAKRLDLALSCLGDDNVPLAESIVRTLVSQIRQVPTGLAPQAPISHSMDNTKGF